MIYLESSTSKCAIFVIGPPGVGKSTIAKLISKRYRCKLVSGGKEIRKMAMKGGEDASLAQQAIASGQKANDDLVMKIYRSCMNTKKRGYVFDGNPGGESQARMFVNELFIEKGIIDFFIIRLTCPKTKCIARILERKDNRNDKEVLTIRNRLAWYNTDVRAAYLVLKRLAKSTFSVSTNRPKSEAFKYVAIKLDLFLK